MMIMMILSNSISDYPIVGIAISVCLVLAKRIVPGYFACFGRNYTLVVTMLILLRLVIVVVISYFDHLTSFDLKITHLLESMLFSI
jgi:hypothetical protein